MYIGIWPAEMKQIMGYWFDNEKTVIDGASSAEINYISTKKTFEFNDCITFLKLVHPIWNLSIKGNNMHTYQ